MRASQARVRFRSEFKHGTLTSGRRTEQGNKIVGGVPGSDHLTGDAADYDGPDLPALRGELLDYYGPGSSAKIHRGHVHLKQPGLNAPFFGRRGTYGLRKR